MPIIKGRDVPPYVVETFDAAGFSIGLRNAETLKEAKETARYMLTDQYASVIETERKAVRVDIRRWADDEVIWNRTL